MRILQIYRRNIISVLGIPILLLICFSFSTDKKLKSQKHFGRPDKDLHFHCSILNYQDGDSLIILYNDDGFESGLSEHDLINLKVGPNSVGEFDFMLPSYGYPARMVLEFTRKNHGGGEINTYIVEPEDEIEIKITMKGTDEATALFSGKGSAKYRCTDSLPDSWTYEGQVFPYKRIYDSHHWLDSFYRNIRQIEIKHLAIVKNYESNISSAVYKLMYEEVKAKFNQLFAYDLESLFFSDTVGLNPSALTPEFRKELVADYENRCLKSTGTSDSAVLIRSSVCRAYIINKTKTDLSFMLGRMPTLKEVFEKIRQDYSGILFDKLIAQLMFNPFNSNGWGLIPSSDDMQYCMEQGAKMAELPYVKKAFQEKSVLSRGQEAYVFSYVDTSGNTVKLSNFKGKVVLIDCWYTGCTGCAIFYKRFTDSIEPYFKSQENFKVISISIDPEKSVWLKSIYKNMYTKANNINLFANAINYRTGILDFYHIDGAPFTLLIDKQGKILLSGLGGFPDSNTEVRKTIQTALEQ